MYTTIARIEEIPPGDCVQVCLAGKTIALFNVNGTYRAIDDTCPHRGAPLSEGPVEGNAVVCPWHGAKFDLETGAHLCPPAAHPVGVYRVQVVNGEIQIDV